MNRKSIVQFAKWFIVGTMITTVALFWKLERQSYIVSSQGSLQSNLYTIGIDYTGVILNILVKAGDRVSKDQPLVVLKSSTLIDRLNESKISKDDLIYDLTSDNNILLKAQNSGVVDKVLFTQGSFIPANSEILNIVDEGYFVTAKFTIPESDFYLIKKDIPAIMSIGNDTYKGSLQDFEILESEDSLIYIEATIIPENVQEFQEYRIGSPNTSRLLIKSNPFRNFFK